jgi:signal transduction histidine kinase
MHDGASLTNHSRGAPARGSDPPQGTPVDRPLKALAHELNSLLDGSLRTLRRTRRAMSLGEPTPESVAADRELDSIEQAMTRMATALARVLDQPGDAPLATLPIAFADGRPLADTARQVVRNLSRVAEEAQVALRLECDRSIEGVATGPLEPLLRNTIRNAIEACGRSPLPGVQGDVSISLRRRGDRLVIDVLDNGPGLPEDGLAHGHGIGLTVAREVVASLRGMIDLSNVPFGRGAVVRVDLPIAQLTHTRAA